MNGGVKIIMKSCKLFLPSQYEEQFLEAMSSQGWRLIDVSNNLMTR